MSHSARSTAEIAAETAWLAGKKPPRKSSCQRCSVRNVSSPISKGSKSHLFAYSSTSVGSAGPSARHPVLRLPWGYRQGRARHLLHVLPAGLRGDRERPLADDPARGRGHHKSRCPAIERLATLLRQETRMRIHLRSLVRYGGRQGVR